MDMSSNQTGAAPKSKPQNELTAGERWIVRIGGCIFVVLVIGYIGSLFFPEKELSRDQKVQKKLHECFGDTSSWTISDWTRVEHDLNRKLDENEAERRTLLSNAKYDEMLSYDLRKKSAKQREERYQELQKQKVTITAAITLVRYVVERNIQDQNRLVADPNIKTNAAVSTTKMSTGTAPKDSAVNHITVGAITFDITSSWTAFSETELAVFRKQYAAQSDDIYRQYNGDVNDPTKMVNVGAFHIDGWDGALVIAAYSIPPQVDLINTLKDEAKGKAEWGVHEGHIQKFVGLFPTENANISGFCLKVISKSGEMTISVTAQHTKRPNEIFQITLICPKSWDDAKTTRIFSSLIESVKLLNKE
jgi:hypothetical protein